ncbi:hypothetical protein JOF41_002636 [Saccharothrix coeruleofusca]|uniref:glycoside hydrolase family 43 protein n=1 Tax=Saccharothrix coeruleofusca TaxID=33919 RepID=UPI001AE8482C|nr:glycoside hydrolase family 43 protein [Saccharothrix coeruleofusca]MBP2336458.1 hypothetical protein [Saccharothrix coeruleofusca]
MRTRLHTAVLAVAATLVALLVRAPAAEAVGPAPHYLMTAFTNTSESNMYVYDSPDATDFALVRANAYTPPTGLIRDPSVMRHTDGRYYVVHTTGWTGDTIAFARSTDGVNWTFLRTLTVGLNGATGSTWAPEWFKDTDGSVHVIFSASREGVGGQFRPYRITATRGDLSRWTAPTPLGIPANFIDSFLVKVDGTYHNFLKNETTKYVEHAVARSLAGPWHFVGTGDWAGWGPGLEGPALVQLPNGRWRIYFDQYGAGRYFYADTPDLRAFGAKAELPGLSGVARHFTVLREEVGDRTAVPAGNRSLRSVDHPDRYVRHRDNVAYLEPVSTALDRQDATFSVVAGLAHTDCYSFESSNYPGHFLRHRGTALVLGRFDGSAGFRGDATFCGRAGLAGRGTTSFESYDHPGHYLRHAGQEMRVEPRELGGRFAADASFSVVAPLA